MNSSTEDFQDEGASKPIPSFDTSAIKLSTISPTLGVPYDSDSSPDYLDYDTKGRGVVTTMFANSKQISAF